MTSKKVKKDHELIIKRGTNIFVHTKSPMTKTDGANLMLKLIDFHTESFALRKIRKRKK